MQLMQASQELFRRTPDECFSSLESLVEYCQRQKDDSEEVWQPPKSLGVLPSSGSQLLLSANGEDGFSMNDWSFGQLCRLSRVSKETVNRLSPQTAAHVFRETLPRAEKQWKDSTSFGRDDLPLVAKVADQVHSWIFEQGQEQNGSRSRGQNGPSEDDF